MNNPETAALAMGSGGAALLAGQAGPQALLPEEVLTVPGAFALGMKAGNAKTNMEIEGGNAYLEMLNHGVSEETAQAIATGVGGINAMLETLQLDELLKAYKILDKVGADDKLTSIVFRELMKRGMDVGVETGQEILQEAATIAGVQAGTKLDTGEWAYSFGDVTDRLWDTAKDSALTFTLTNVPSTVHNVSTQNHNRLVAAGEANILAGKMPTSEQLRAMNMTEAEALGKMAVLQMGDLDDAVDNSQIGQTFGETSDTVITDGSHLVDGQLKPNVTYKTGEHDYIYQTNESGLISCVIVDELQFKIHDGRLNHNPNTYGKLEGDHAGHLIGDRFGGSPELDNLVSQAKDVNMSEYKVIENKWATALTNGRNVSVRIDINYSTGITRPISFDVFYCIDGVEHHQTIKN